MPLIPGINNDRHTLDEIGAFLGKLPVSKMKVLPYHSLARSKYIALDMRDTMPDAPSPTDDELNQAAEILRNYGINAISGRE